MFIFYFLITSVLWIPLLKKAGLSFPVLCSNPEAIGLAHPPKHAGFPLEQLQAGT